MIDIKQYGAFIEHTIRPLLEESEDLIDKLKVLGFRASDIRTFLSKLAVIHIVDSFLDFLKTVICIGIIGFVSWKISR